jgi:transposase
MFGMPKAIFIRSLTAAERAALEAGVRSPDALVMRRCQRRLANARGESAIPIAQHLSCHDQTVRNASHAFNQTGLASLQPGSSVRHPIGRAFEGEPAERWRARLHQSRRNFGQATSLWTLALTAEVSDAQGVTPEPVSPQTVRATLERLGIGWRRAQAWITSPDPECARKKRARPAARLGRGRHAFAVAGTGARPRRSRSQSLGRLRGVGWAPRPPHSPRAYAVALRGRSAGQCHHDRLSEMELSANELADRVCARFDCPHEPHLIAPEKVP